MSELTYAYVEIRIKADSGYESRQGISGQIESAERKPIDALKSARDTLDRLIKVAETPDAEQLEK